MTPDLILDPEVVIFLDNLADENGWAHRVQKLPDGPAHYVKYGPDELGKSVRWMALNTDQEAMGGKYYY